MSWRFCCVIPVVLVGMLAGRSAAGEATLVNLTPANAPALVAALEAAGLKPVVARADAREFAANLSGPLLVWEARAGGSREVTSDAAGTIGVWVAKGGRLLLTLSDDPGVGAMRLSFLLPTTAWQTQGQARSAALKTGGGNISEVDSELFPPGPFLPRLALPFYYPLRPFHAVERGEGRYERFERTIPYVDITGTAARSFWTRPLINRDWRVRASADDLAHTPVLLTGRYGAGRVAVFASSAAGAGSEAKWLWDGIARWLLADDPKIDGSALPGSASVNSALPPPMWEVDAAHRLLRVTVRNPQTRPIDVRVIARVRTWERAIIGDAEQALNVPASGTAVAELPLPKPGPDQYQALQYQDAFDIRLGILSADGGVLLNESRVQADLRPPLLVSVATDNLRAVEYPFAASGPQTPTFPSRMGMEVNAYAYQPGQTVDAHVTIANGVRNIAVLAEADDLTTPGNASAMALNDDAAHAEQGAGTDGIQAYGNWTGVAGRENVLRFTFPSPVILSGVTLVGSADSFRFHATHNPGAVIIEADGQEVARGDDLDKRFLREFGAVRCAFAPIRATVLRLRLPWVNKPVPETGGDRPRQAPWLGEVRIDGSTTALPEAQAGTLSLTLRDAMSGVVQPVGQQELTVPSGAQQTVHVPLTLPKSDGTHFYRLEGTFAGHDANAPLMAIAPAHPLAPLRDLKPPSAPDMGFIVTRGFRNIFDVGTGTAEMGASWGQPDDLVWAYSHQMKQLGRTARTRADRLYLSESDMRHYSTPWRSLPDGTYLYDIAPDRLVSRMKQDRRWKDSPVAILAHSDRWDTAPDVDALHGWQDFIDFDQSLRAAGQPGLQGRTHREIAAEIHEKYEHRWQAWQLERYVHAIRNLNQAFAREGKRLIITAQGSPLVPSKDEAELAGTIRGQSDDSTWGMIDESVPLTTGRQMGVMAFNPGWAMSTLLQWGFDSGVLNNPHWHNAVGTTEPSRRHLYDRAWRGIIGRDGTYRSMHTYGYNTNAGLSYTMTENDWQESWRVQERHSLISPDAPIGAGIVISTARFADPEHASFSGSGGSGSSEADVQVRAVAQAVRRLEESGISVPFTANAALLDHWPANAPMVLLDVDLFSAEELAALRKLQAAGVKMAAFTSARQATLPAGVAALFGVNPDGSAAAGQKIADVAGAALIATPNTLFAALPLEDLGVTAAQALAAPLHEQLQLPIKFPSGTAGYGFVSQGIRFVVVEDWMERGRTVSLTLHASDGATHASAVDVNDHRTLAVRREGSDWVIAVPIRPGDGVLVAVEESK